jgi:Phosphoinositide phospholipase C, Ca2+-dependent
MRRRVIGAVVAVLAVATAVGTGTGSAGSAPETRGPRCPASLVDRIPRGPAGQQQARLLADRCVRINEIQVLGTHNSYHVQGRPSVFAALSAFDAALARTLEYTHAPLRRQVRRYGIRQLELDVFADPEGGLYADRAGLRVVGEDPIGPAPLHEPGMKVLHVQDIDFESRCLTLKKCLRQLRRWSDRNPRHLPVVVQIEPKDDVLPDLGLGFVDPIPFRAPEFDDLDAEIRSILGPRKLITPDGVRGNRSSLEQAVLQDGWPTLGEARGRFLFALDTGGPKLDAYVAGHPALADRVMFTDSAVGTPEAGYLVRNDPVGGGAAIRDLVRRGYLIRTRADADTEQARTGDTTMQQAAFASGAQLVSTDYPVPETLFGTGYVADLPGDGTARCNPVNAPPGCDRFVLEDLGSG